MERYLICCESCAGAWTVASSLSLYEQQARESHPCPQCGAYTLRCAAADAKTILEFPSRPVIAAAG